MRAAPSCCAAPARLSRCAPSPRCTGCPPSASPHACPPVRRSRPRGRRRARGGRRRRPRDSTACTDGGALLSRHPARESRARPQARSARCTGHPRRRLGAPRRTRLQRHHQRRLGIAAPAADDHDKRAAAPVAPAGRCAASRPQRDAGPRRRAAPRPLRRAPTSPCRRSSRTSPRPMSHTSALTSPRASPTPRRPASSNTAAGSRATVTTSTRPCASSPPPYVVASARERPAATTAHGSPIAAHDILSVRAIDTRREWTAPQPR